MSKSVNPYQTPETKGVEGDILIEGFIMIGTWAYSRVVIISLWSVVVLSVYLSMSTNMILQNYGGNAIIMYTQIRDSGPFGYYSVWEVRELCNLIVVVSIVAVLIWKFLSMNNAWVFKKMKMLPTVSRSWAVIWYIVPVANLWKPYEAMTEIICHTFGEFKYKMLIRLWWLVCLVGVFPIFKTLTRYKAESISELKQEVLAYSCIAVGSFLMIMIILRVTRAQTVEIKYRKAKLIM